MPESFEGPSNRIPALDGLRGWAALSVLIFHYFEYTSLPTHLQNLIVLGGKGVPLFFVVSGFLIFRSLERGFFHEAWRLEFYRKRALRILPLWWVSVLLFAYLQGWPVKVMLLNLSFGFGFVFFDPVNMPNVVGWSLFAEEIFYLIVPWFFHCLRRLRNLPGVLVAFYLLSLFWKQRAGEWGVPYTNSYIVWSPLAVFPLFLAGGLLARLYENRAFRDWLAHQGTLRFAGITPFDLLAFVSYFGPILLFRAPDEFTFSLIVLTALIPGSAISRLGSLPLIRWTGVRCYFIYVVHFPLEQTLFPRWTLLTEPFEWPWLVREMIGKTLIAGVVLAAAALSWRYFEQPLNRLAHPRHHG